MAELDPKLYTIAWLAPLEIEAQAALHMLDNRHEGRFPMSRGDDYVFQAGNMCGHNIIIATLPAGQEYGTGSAAALASQVKNSFPNLWFGLLVGVAAGLPNLSRIPPLDIRLGDVLVGLPTGESAGLIAYDLGKETGDNGFQLLRFGHVLANTETVVMSAIGSIRLRAPNDAEVFLPYYESIKHKEHANGTFIDPGQEQDRLYQLNDDGIEHLVERERRTDSRRARVWYGSIGSGEKLMKNAPKRNELRDKYNVIGLEMEAAGTMNRIHVGVIRGVCDYGDEHKTKGWQPYAAAMAAAYAKAILHEIPPKSLLQQSNHVERSKSKLTWSDVGSWAAGAASHVLVGLAAAVGVRRPQAAGHAQVSTNNPKIHLGEESNDKANSIGRPLLENRHSNSPQRDPPSRQNSTPKRPSRLDRKSSGQPNTTGVARDANSSLSTIWKDEFSDE